jgi:hypothetical protein
MVAVLFNKKTLYTANNVTKEGIKESDCLFSHKDGNDKDCFFVSEWGKIRDAGGVIIEIELTKTETK